MPAQTRACARSDTTASPQDVLGLTLAHALSRSIWPAAGFWNPGEGAGFVARCHPEARCLTAGCLPSADPGRGRVAVLGAGTSDLPVAAEAEESTHYKK